jgi:serine/threonine protein kinase/tetratricopeptide (TPR) repeat protein
MNTATVAAGSLLGRFRIEGRLGAGGMGEVYRATDTKLGRPIALKILPPQYIDEPGRRERFEREARAASALNHPNIVTVYDAGVEGNLPWIAMEFVEGQTLREIVRHGAVPTPKSLLLALPLADALAKAHEIGVVHRDLKPENIMVTAEGIPKILDFGIARFNTDTDVTQSITAVEGSVTGTLGYMAPEQLLGKSTDHRADQFAFGTVLYEMATGVNPFSRDTAPQTIAAILETQPRLEVYPEPYSAVVNRCLNKEPSQRYASTREIAAQLRAVQESTASPRSRRWALATALGVLVAVTGSAYWAMRVTRITSGERMLAVRTFKNLSSDPAQEYFSGGLTEEVRSRLSKISSIRLLSRSAVDAYGDGDVKKMAAELKAGHLVEGTVRADKNRVRIAVYLIDTATFQTIWSEQFDRALNDILSVQNEVALRVTEALQAAVRPDERRRVERRATQNAAAYDLYLQGLKFTRRGRDSIARAISLFKQAVELDPKFADAMGEISYNLIFANDPRSLPEAIDWAEKAIAADSESASGHEALAMAYASKGWITKSGISFRRAIELDPNKTSALNNFSITQAQLAHFDDSLRLARQALARNPNSAPTYYHIAVPLQFIGSDNEFQRWMDIWQPRFPSFHRVFVMQSTRDIAQGKKKEVLAAARKLADRSRGNIELEILVADLAMSCDEPDAENLLLKSSAGNLDPNYMQYMLLPESPRVRLAWYARKRGDRVGAEKLLTDAERVAMEHWRGGVEAPSLPVELAAIQSMRGNTQEAVTWMNRAYDLGWRERHQEAIDPMLAEAARDPQFQQITRRMEEDLRRQASESRELKLLFEESVPALPPPRPPK